MVVKIDCSNKNKGTVLRNTVVFLCLGHMKCRIGGFFFFAVHRLDFSRLTPLLRIEPKVRQIAHVHRPRGRNPIRVLTCDEKTSTVCADCWEGGDLGS